MNVFCTAVFLLIAGVAMAQAPSGSQAETQQPTPAPAVKSFDLSAIDKTTDACTDFYQYACGNWMKNNPVPSSERRWSRSFSALRERNLYLLWQELDAAAKNPQSPLQKQYGDYYAACLNTDLVETKGLEPLRPALKRIAELHDAKGLASLISELTAQGFSAEIFQLSVGQDRTDASKQIATISQGGMSLPDRGYYLGEHFRYTRTQFIRHMTAMFILAGDKDKEAFKEAQAVLNIETSLALASANTIDVSGTGKYYHVTEVADFQKLAPDFDFGVYFKGVNAGRFDALNVATPDFFRALNGLIDKQPTDVWKSYLRWHVLTALAQDLPKAYRDQDFFFFGQKIAKRKEPSPRWKQCTEMTDAALGDAVTQDWVKRNFPLSSKASMDRLIATLEESLRDEIKTLSWMSDDTRKAAEEKLSMIRNQIGFPEKWRDYSALNVDRDDAVGNTLRSAVFRRNSMLSKLGRPVDGKEWEATPTTVNASYSSSMNSINLPATIIQPPFFDPEIDPAVNFGGIGVVAGHELTHAFDDQGARFDGKGNLRDWQTPGDRRKFVEQTNCEVAQYGGAAAAPVDDDDETPRQNLNGKLALRENTADQGGLRIAYLALRDTLAAQGKSVDDKIDGYTEKQRFFLGFAQVWCENEDKQPRKKPLIDPHLAGPWRVNGTVQNFEEFGKAFGCTKGQPMYPANACRVW
jgi:putative endopeptidase